MDQKGSNETFGPILQFMAYQPGMSIADVGAGSGALTVMMSTLMDSSTVYIQDIDTTVLKESNIDKILDYHSKQSGRDLRATNDFHTVIGTVERTNLPNATFDLIYTNATVHNFTSIDSTIVDLGRKLKPNGQLFIRDSFRNDHGEGEYCSDKKCGRRLLTIEEFLAVMERNGFKKVKHSPDMSGYPVFGFSMQ
jgi:ubiquinone/menaquinone biosynthesis C-methylase UbiE